jgi:hypothetical protein
LLQDTLNGISTLETPDLERFVFEVGKMIAARKSTHLEKKETQLLKAINNSIPNKELIRYQILLEKNQNETISETEHQEFLVLNEKIEQININRLKKIIELARFRGVSVPTLMSDLNLYSNGIA